MIDAPAGRELTEEHRLLLRVSAAGGGSAVGLRGTRQWNLARRLVRLGLGEIVSVSTTSYKKFKATPAGLALVAPPDDDLEAVVDKLEREWSPPARRA